MIICTKNDKEFYKYKNKISDRTVKFTIKQIFKDWWSKFLTKFHNLNIRDTVFKNVEKMLKCRTWDLGYAIYECPNCGKEKIVPHTFKSRMCSSCENKYNKQRKTSIFTKLFKYKHRHVVFTIPKELRIYFRKDRKRFDLLFKASEITIKYWIKDKYKKYDLIPAFISVLHTFGRNKEDSMTKEEKTKKVMKDGISYFGKDEIIYIYECTKCHKLDPVPGFVIGEQLGFLKFAKQKNLMKWNVHIVEGNPSQ